MRRLALLPVLCLALSAWAAPDFDLGPEVGAYTRFLVYPHLDKGFRELERGRGDWALREFQRARELAPDNAYTALYLAEAYRRLGRDKEARRVLEAQRELTPAHPALLAELARYAKAPPAACVELDCRIQRAYRELADGALAAAASVLDNEAVARTDAGLALRRALVQRAIALGQDEVASNQLARLHGLGRMNAQEAGQWFTLMLRQGRVDDALSVQRHYRLEAPEQQLAAALALGRAGDASALAAYLGARRPPFARAADERQWLALLGRAASSDVAVLRAYAPHHAANRAEYARLAFVAALDGADWAWAEQIWQQSGATAAGLETLSYRLLQAGEDRAALALLLRHYPFGDAAYRPRLLQRLAMLAARHPVQLGVAERERLALPLAGVAERGWQAAILDSVGDCAGVRRVLSDGAEGYGVSDWLRLGNCYRDTAPGLAQWAYGEAARQGSAQAVRARAYLASAAHDAGKALALWSSLPMEALTPDELLAAASSAAAAGDMARLDAYLQRYRQRAGARSDAYLWLEAQRLEAAGQSGAAIAALQAMASPDAGQLVRLAGWLEQAGQGEAALHALERAQRLAPGEPVVLSALGYAHWNAGRAGEALPLLERAQAAWPDDPALGQQLVYVDQRLQRNESARHRAELAIDDLLRYPAQEADDARAGTLFGLRRLHEDMGRRWTFLADARSGGASSLLAGDAPSGVDGSYAQLEAEYRLGQPALRDGRTLSAYGRLFAGDDRAWSWRAPTLGLGLRWKPLRDDVLLLAVEQQQPLGTEGRSDTLLRASASFLNGGRFSDDWHPAGRGWLAQNLYLDGARYLRQRVSATVADYRLSYHHKLAEGQTLEPYAHLQHNGRWPDEGSAEKTLLVGVGLRWNVWSGQRRYDAYPHKLSLGVELQRTLESRQDTGDGVFLTLGGRW